MSDLTAGQITAFFDRIASDWDEMRLVYYDEAVIDHLAAATELDASMTVADVGTGTCFVAAGLAGRVARVSGIDDSPGMLEVAEENLSELGVTNVELRRGDVGALPLADDSVDAAVANMVLHHAVDPGAMLGEMARIVRPGGTVARAPGPGLLHRRRRRAPEHRGAGSPVKHRIDDLGRGRDQRHLRRPRTRPHSAPMSSQSDHAREALERVCARGDLQRARELYAEDFIDHVNALDFHGQDGIARSVALYRAIFPDLEIRVLDQSTDGDHVTSRWTLHGTHKGRAVTSPASPSAASRTTRSPRTGPSRTTSSRSAGSASAVASRSPPATSPRDCPGAIER